MKKVKKELNDLMMFVDEAQEAIKIVTESYSSPDREYFAKVAQRRLESIRIEVEILDANYNIKRGK